VSKHAFVLFQYQKDANLPLVASFMDDDGNAVRTYPLFIPKSGIPLNIVFDNLKKVREEFNGQQLPIVTINDFKTLLDTLKPEDYDFNAYDFGVMKQPNLNGRSEIEIKKFCETCLLKASEVRPSKWMRILGKASIAYHAIQRRGLKHGYLDVYPKYALDTISGRSKTIGFNVQGTDSSYDIRHPDESKKFFIHLDWISADLRAAQLLSGDEILAEAFRKSDPYTVMAKGELTRADCKGMMIRALYEMDLENPALQFFPKLFKWVQSEKERLEAQSFTESVLGRRFKMVAGGDVLHNMRSVFNASLQGSVVHAMQNALWSIFKVIPDSIVCEMHDSITLATDRNSLKDVLKVGVEAMLHPFQGVLDYNPTFPLRIFIGKHWKRWKPCGEVR
jgi:hypothetical protein